MKRAFFILLTLSLSFAAMAQETTRQHEIGLVTRNLDNFGLTFKTGTNQKLWRFNSMMISGSSSKETADSLETKQTSTGFRIGAGREFRIPIVEKLEFIYGADVSFSYNHSDYNSNANSVISYDRIIKRTTYQPGINLVFGLNYKINEHFILGAELSPGFSYITGYSKESGYNNIETKSDISGFNYGLSNTDLLLTIAYRF